MAVSVQYHPPTILPSSKEHDTLRWTMGELRSWCVYSGKSRISSRDAKLSYSDQVHPVGSKAVIWYIPSIWKMEVEAAGSSTTFILRYQTQRQHIQEHHNLGT